MRYNNGFSIVDYIPLLSQWIKKHRFEPVFFWCGQQDLQGTKVTEQRNASEASRYFNNSVFERKSDKAQGNKMKKNSLKASFFIFD